MKLKYSIDSYKLYWSAIFPPNISIHERNGKVTKKHSNYIYAKI